MQLGNRIGLVDDYCSEKEFGNKKVFYCMFQVVYKSLKSLKTFENN